MNKLLLFTFCVLVTNLCGQEMLTFEQEPLSFWKDAGSYEFKNANAFEVELNLLSVLDNERDFGPIWNIVYAHNTNRVVYLRGRSGKNEIVVMDLETQEEIISFPGQSLHAVSLDGNRIFFESSIYDIKEEKKYVLTTNIFGHHEWNNGTIVWLNDDYIISYQNWSHSGEPNPKKYLKLDLNDLQIKKMSQSEVDGAHKRIENLKATHSNFYLYSGSKDIVAQDLKTPYAKSILHSKNGFPIRRFWASPNLEYVIVDKFGSNYKYELLLYKLTYKENSQQLFFKATNPDEYIGDKLKEIYDETNGVGIWANVYAPNINPLTNKVIGPDRNKYKGSIRVVKDLGDDSFGLMVGWAKNKFQNGDVITDFRKDETKKDNNGAWAVIEEWTYYENKVYDFTSLNLGDDDIKVLTLHSILNKNTESTVANSGINSPGNESSLFVEATSEAIINFQKLKGLNPTGIIDEKTSAELNRTFSIGNKVYYLKKLN